MGMLSEEEKQELRAMASSSAIRDEFRQLRKSSYPDPERPVDIDQLLSFLTAMSRLSSVPAQPRAFVPYTNVRI